MRKKRVSKFMETSNSKTRKPSDSDKTKLSLLEVAHLPADLRSKRRKAHLTELLRRNTARWHSCTMEPWPSQFGGCCIQAQTMYLHLISNGWEATRAKYNPDAAARQADPTVGQFIEAAEAVADLETKTLRGYVGALRKIVADIAGLASDSAKFGSGQGRKDWLKQIHGVKLSALTPKAIQEWKRSFLSKAEPDPVSQRSARVSVNTFLRCARSLFSPRILEHMEIEMPKPLPFSGCQFEPGQNMKYRSTFDVQTLIGSARDELAIVTRKHSKSFCLERWWGCGAGRLTSWSGRAFAGTRARSASRQLSIFRRSPKILTPTSRLTLNWSNSSADTTPARPVLSSSSPPASSGRGVLTIIIGVTKYLSAYRLAPRARSKSP